MKILICDDEVRFCEKYKAYLQNLCLELKCVAEIQTHTSASYLLRNLDDWIESTDLLFLDIHLGDGNGIDISKKVREMGYSGDIAFLTVSSEYVFDAFDVSPVNYFVKREGDQATFKDKIRPVLERIISEDDNKFYFNVKGALCFVKIKQIIYFEVKKRVIRLVYETMEQSFKGVEFYSPLEAVEDVMEQKNYNFIKIHRSFIVNPYYVIKISRKEVEMVNGQTLPISRTCKDTAFKAFLKYVESDSGRREEI